MVVVSLGQLQLNAPSTPLKVTVGQPAVDLAFGDPTKANDLIAKRVDSIAQWAIDERSSILILPEGIADDKSFPPSTPFR
ncbi:hypothetical protein ABTN51_19565, partial [Acinetobacter baumannii]